jgi:hypothetical protein
MRAQFVCAALVAALAVYLPASPAGAEEGAPPAASSEVREAQAQAAATLAAMTTASTRAMWLLLRARVRRAQGVPEDEVRCVDRNVTMVDVALKRAREQTDRARGAWAQADVTAAHRAMTMLALLHQASRVALHDAEMCMAPNGTTRQDGTVVSVYVAP